MHTKAHESAAAGPDLRAGESARLLLGAEVHAVVGAAFAVLNGLGTGFPEKVYENALLVEFRRRDLPAEQQRRFPVLYHGEPVGEFVPDLIAHGQVIVEVKVGDQLGDHERGQLLNYLRVTRLRVGVLLNFRKPRLEWERLVL
jgi:GxxExxY protein